MNSSNTALQTGHHHHHHQPASSSSANQQFTSATQQTHPKVNPSVVNPNPSVHRFQSLNENPWQLQTQQQQNPVPPLRHHKKAIPILPPNTLQSGSNLLSKSAQHLTVNSTYNSQQQQPVYLSSSTAQTQTTPGLQHPQLSPKSPNQNFVHQPINVMSSSLNSGNFNSTNMINNHHHPHSSSSNSNNNNNNNNNNFNDLNLNGASSFVGGNSNNQKKIDLKHNTMTWFHGSITREEAERLLQPREEGLFLVRESTNYPGDYTLCVCFQEKVEHYRVKYHEKKLTIDDEEYFDTLSQLIEHYEQDADGLCTQLMKPLEKFLNTQIKHCLDSNDFIAQGWVIQEKDLQLKESIGKGEFGDVMLGYLKGERVAVKMLKDTTAAAQKFLAEASVMTTLEHKNLVKFIGLVLNKQHIYLVTEYMSKGSLVDYLRSRGRQHITRKDQINFASDTCSGMEYLEQKKVVHRDLAARNVLISEDCVAKVADFGLAKNDEDCTNNSTDVGKLPIKWSAPEALKSGQFSNKSDIWSFGILLWEIYSFGRVPYPRIPLAEVAKHVEAGYKMESPEGCPGEIYDMMKQCWDLNPFKRPTFKDLAAKLNQLKSTTV